MSAISELKANIDDDITNRTLANSISPIHVGGNMKTLADLTAFPVGCIMMYHPANLSEFNNTGLGQAQNVLNWAICNGQNGTPDLRGKFVVGHHPGDPDYDQIGDTGGSKTVTLTVAQIPSHTHGLGSEMVEINPAEVTVGDAWDNGANGNYPNGTGTGPTGGGQAHENRPPYYTVVYIMRIN